jgi:Phage integrase family
VLNLPRLHKDQMAKKHGIVYQVSDVSFEGVLPNGQTRERPLKVSEKKTLLPACSPWLRKLLIVAMETCLSRSDLLRLTWDDIDWDDGVIVPGGGRKKTQVRQIAPLTETVRTILEEIKQDRKRSKVENIAGTGLVFGRDDGRPISGNAITKALHKACKRAKVRNFRFHDTQPKQNGLAKVFRLKPRCLQQATRSSKCTRHMSTCRSLTLARLSALQNFIMIFKRTLGLQLRTNSSWCPMTTLACYNW